MTARDSRRGVLNKVIKPGLWIAVMLFGMAALLMQVADAGANSPRGSISRNVLAFDGVTPIEGAVVFVNDFWTGVTAGTATSSADGTYTVLGITTGDYRVVVDATLQGFPIQYYNGAADAESATPVSVSDGFETPSIDFTLGAGATISGTVYEADGVTPVANAEVWAESYDCCGGGEGARTTADGTYTIRGLAPGDYLVEAQNDGHAREFYQETSDFRLASWVTLTGGANTTGSDFTLETGATISGTVYEADGVTPVADVDVWAESYDCCGGGEGARTAADGTYIIRGLAPGGVSSGGAGPGAGTGG